LRRCRSTSKAETIVTEEEKMRRAQPDKPWVTFIVKQVNFNSTLIC
jgi:hypothetical protein